MIGYHQYIKEHFNDIKFRGPLFNNINYRKHSLRFELGQGDTTTNSYFTEAITKAVKIFKSVFDENDTIYIILNDFRYKRRKIRFGNYLFKQIENLSKSEIVYFRNYAVIKCTSERVNFENIISAIANADFPPREPRLDNYPIASKEIYFININKYIIVHMYDDRGLDILAQEKDKLTSLYHKFNNYIPDYNRKNIDMIFNKAYD